METNNSLRVPLRCYDFSMKPVLSIVIPVYNTNEYFAACLDSAVSQLDDQTEIIIVDDGSTDGSTETALAYAEKYPSLIRVIRQENRGNTIARYAGIRETKGDYIAFLDSDDLLDPAWYASIRSVIDSQEPDMIILRWQKFDDEGHLFETERPPLFPEGPVAKEDVLKVYLSSQRVTSLPLKVVKREMFTEETDYSDNGRRRLMEDKLMSMQLFRNASSFWYLPQILYNYRTNFSSITIRAHENEHRTLTYTYPPLLGFLKDTGFDSEEYMLLLVENYASVMWEILLKLHRTESREKNLQACREIHDFSFTSLVPERIDAFTLAEYKITGIRCLLEEKYEQLYDYIGEIRKNPDLDHMPHLRKLGKI